MLACAELCGRISSRDRDFPERFSAVQGSELDLDVDLKGYSLVKFNMHLRRSDTLWANELPIQHRFPIL